MIGCSLVLLRLTYSTQLGLPVLDDIAMIPAQDDLMDLENEHDFVSSARFLRSLLRLTCSPHIGLPVFDNTNTMPSHNDQMDFEEEFDVFLRSGRFLRSL